MNEKYIITYSVDTIPIIKNFDDYQSAFRMWQLLLANVNENRINIDYIRFEKHTLLNKYEINPRCKQLCLSYYE